MAVDGLRFALQPRQVEAFRAVALTGSMTSAAGILCVSQPAVSRLIRDFERSVGLKLFQRQGNHLVPTPEALLLISEIDRCFVGLQQIARSAEDIRNLRTGSLKVAATPAISTKYIAKILSAFLSEYADVSVALQSVQSLMICDLVARHQVDIGVGVTPREYPGVVWEALPRLEAVCVVPKTHSLANAKTVHQRDLAGQQLIVRSGGSQLRARVEALLTANGIRYNPVIECNLAITMCAFVCEGIGLAIVDPFTAREFSEDCVMRLPLTPSVPYECAVAFPAHRPRPQLVHKFSELLKASVESDFCASGEQSN